MQANTTSGNESDAVLADCGEYQYSLSSHGTHTWCHPKTFLQIVVRKQAGRDQYGRDFSGYRVVARSQPGSAGQAVDHVTNRSCLESKRDAIRAAREWMEARPDGTLRGDEEADY